jgi:hypothetical protein
MLRGQLQRDAMMRIARAPAAAGAATRPDGDARARTRAQAEARRGRGGAAALRVAARRPPDAAQRVPGVPAGAPAAALCGPVHGRARTCAAPLGVVTCCDPLRRCCVQQQTAHALGCTRGDHGYHGTAPCCVARPAQELLQPGGEQAVRRGHRDTMRECGWRARPRAARAQPPHRAADGSGQGLRCSAPPPDARRAELAPARARRRACGRAGGQGGARPLVRGAPRGGARAAPRGRHPPAAGPPAGRAGPAAGRRAGRAGRAGRAAPRACRRPVPARRGGRARWCARARAPSSRLASVCAGSAVLWRVCCHLHPALAMPGGARASRARMQRARVRVCPYAQRRMQAARRRLARPCSAGRAGARPGLGRARACRRAGRRGPGLRAGGYRVLATGQAVALHPSSVLCGKRPPCIVFDELLRTTRDYARQARPRPGALCLRFVSLCLIFS